MSQYTVIGVAAGQADRRSPDQYFARTRPLSFTRMSINLVGFIAHILTNVYETATPMTVEEASYCIASPGTVLVSREDVVGGRERKIFFFHRQIVVTYVTCVMRYYMTKRPLPWSFIREIHVHVGVYHKSYCCIVNQPLLFDLSPNFLHVKVRWLCAQFECNAMATSIVL